MFGRDSSEGSDEDPPSIVDQVGHEEAGIFRTQDRDCDKCESSEGSVIVKRETDTARCRDCYNDPSTWEES